MVMWLLFWDKPVSTTSWWDHPPKDQWGSHHTGYLKFGVLKPSHRSEIKHSRTVPQGTHCTDADKMKKGILVEAWDIRGEIVSFIVRASWTSPCMNFNLWGRDQANEVLHPFHQQRQTSVRGTAHTVVPRTDSTKPQPAVLFKNLF